MASTKRAQGAPGRVGRASGQQRWYAWFDGVMFAGLLNALIIVFTLAGGVVFGWAPALAAAAACSRRRLRGETFAVIRTFARAWSAGFVHANLLLAPPGLALVLIGSSLVGTQGRPGSTALTVALWIACGVCGSHLVLTVTMDAHYELRRGRCLRLAWAFMLRFPGAPLLLAATTTLIVVATLFVPGLLPVLTIGAWVHLCTALSLSFYAANERVLDRSDAPPTAARPDRGPMTREPTITPLTTLHSQGEPQ